MKYTEINYNFVLGYYVVPEPKKEVKTAIDDYKRNYPGRKRNR